MYNQIITYYNTYPIRWKINQFKNSLVLEFNRQYTKPKQRFDSVHGAAKPIQFNFTELVFNSIGFSLVIVTELHHEHLDFNILITQPIKRKFIAK